MFGDKAVFKLFAAFGIFIFIVVSVRLFHLQVIEGKRYKAFIASQINTNISVSTNRGYIYDKDGNVLATNRKTASLFAFGKNIGDKGKFFSELSRNGISVGVKAKKSLAKNDSFTWVARRVDIEKADKMVNNIKGLEYFKEEGRFYPQGTLMANLLGFTGVDNEGLSGIEYALNKDLNGKTVTVAAMRDSRGNRILFDDKSDVLKPETEAYLTISSRIQAAGEYLLRKGAKTFGAKNGSVVAMDIKTGEIILDASVQSFDPQQYWKYQKNVWKNHGFTYAYEPGSIFKAVSFGFLKENGLLANKPPIDTSKKFSIAGYTYSDTKDYGILSVEEVFTHSSNVGVAMLAKDVNNKNFYDYLRKCGFGAKTGIYGASEESGMVRDASLWSRTSRTSMAIGYEVLVTPLQMVRFYAAIANGGVMVNPKVISKIITDDQIKKIEHKEERILSEATAKYLLELMQKTVETGTGSKARTMLTKVAGKTGTASIYDAALRSYSKQNYSASFAGVFPAEKPKIAMIVVYESPTLSIYGGSTAANVFRQIAEFVSTENRYFEPELRVATNDGR